MSLAQLTPISSDGDKTMKQKVLESLREAIMRGYLESGQQLRQDDIAFQLGVSRIPVREALMQLEAEGLVTFYPYKGAVVSTLSPDEAKEIFEIRFILESEALRFAFPNLSNDVLDEALRLVEEAGAEKDSANWSDQNWKFHSFLYQYAKRPRLLAMIDSLNQNIDRYIRIYLRTLSFQSESIEAHKQLITALRERNIEKAVDLLKEHLKNAEHHIIQYLTR
ncbi:MULTISPECIES: GntR family transcriptional regulator [Aminobacterium]|uniref:GntR family transcriptional regulator n=1 Tax=Aminobacterium TaxID=81466 RepID=UPI0004637550|nr:MULTISPECIES: GntR family transcriptional regulator [Aminobacterium]